MSCTLLRVEPLPVDEQLVQGEFGVGDDVRRPVGEGEGLTQLVTGGGPVGGRGVDGTHEEPPEGEREFAAEM